MGEHLINKNGVYWPSDSLVKSSLVKKSIYAKAAKSPIKFWESLSKSIDWFKPWKKSYEQKLPFYKWFIGGKLNLSYNCLDRHLKNKPNKTALIWVPENPKAEEVKLTYNQLYEKVNQLSNLLKRNGIKKGDVVAIYLPMIPEAIISMLACSRIGAVHCVVFSAFSAEALRTRLDDSGAKLLISCDTYSRKGKTELLEEKVIESIKGSKVEKTLFLQRTSKKPLPKNFISWQDIEKESKEFKAEEIDSEDPLFLLYTSGTTGKPKGILHTTGGYAVQTMNTARLVFNILEEDIFWCTADIGWITGHSYVCYGPLLNGITTLIYEGAFDYPDFSRAWKIIQDNKVTTFYTAPTAIRMFKTYSEQFIDKFNLSSLKILGTVGEPIDETTWLWYFHKIGKSKCPVIDTWWQTETGGVLIASLPGIGPFMPSFAAVPFPGLKIAILDEKGKAVKKGETGDLVILPPLPPGALRNVWNSPEKYEEKYWPSKKYYLTGDSAFISEGYIRITGRADDVLKVAGHRISTAEIENATQRLKGISENAVVSQPDYIKGEVPVIFAKLKAEASPSDKLKEEISSNISKIIGPIAKPSAVYFVPDLPKTRSGKIMRRILKALLRNEPLGELSTIVNPECIEKIRNLITSKQ